MFHIVHITLQSTLQSFMVMSKRKFYKEKCIYKL